MAKRRFNNVEIASLANDPFLYGGVPTFGKIRISSRDRTLVEKGGTDSQAIELYLNLLSDPHVYAMWDKQITEITSKDWYLEAGGESETDRQAFEYVEKTLRNLSLNTKDYDSETGLGIISGGVGLDGLTRGLGLSLITGISYAEIIWKRDDNGGPTIDNIKIRDPRRFHFDIDESGKVFLKVRTRKHWGDGIFVPPRKFIVHRHWSIPNDDPYGDGIGRILYYPVQWKREILTLWLSIIDKYSDPTAIGKYEDDISEEDKRVFDEALGSIARDMVISMPSSYSVDFVSPSLSSVDLLGNLEKLCNTYISKVISGEATTGEEQAGSVKQTVSNSIRLMKAKGFSDLISETINNTLIKWLCKYRFPKANPPKLWRNFNDVTEKVELLNRIKTLGFNTTQEYVEDLTGIPLEVKQRSKGFAMS